MSEIIATNGLVLRKSPFSETSLIFVLLTPDHGQVHFLARGAQQTGRTKFPVIDLFRLLRVSYRPSRKSDLQTARDVELETDFSRIAAVPMHFRTALWLTRFALRNSVAEDPAPQLFAALFCAFARLAGPRLPSCIPVYLAVMFSALNEHGLLPDLTDYPAKAAAMAELLAFAADVRRPTPAYDDRVWGQLAQWACDHLERTELHIPEGLEEIS